MWLGGSVVGCWLLVASVVACWCSKFGVLCRLCVVGCWLVAGGGLGGGRGVAWRKVSGLWFWVVAEVGFGLRFSCVCT